MLIVGHYTVIVRSARSGRRSCCWDRRVDFWIGILSFSAV